MMNGPIWSEGFESGLKSGTSLPTQRPVAAFHQTFSQFKQTGYVHDLEFDFMRKDGSLLPVVMGATELLLESDLDPSQRQFAQNVHRSSQDLLEVIDKLLSEVTESRGSRPPRPTTGRPTAMGTGAG